MLKKTISTPTYRVVTYRIAYERVGVEAPDSQGESAPLEQIIIHSLHDYERSP